MCLSSLQVGRLDKNVFVDESDGYAFVFLETAEGKQTAVQE
ncbi:MAG: hypothetical protein WB567_08440 [Terracidiphilus sp.]